MPGLIALAVMAVAGGVANFAGLDHAHSSNLSGTDLATSVSQGIQAQRNLASPPQVSCPASEPERPGLHFTCQWHQGSNARPIEVTETDGRGEFHFSVPSPRN